MSASCLADPGQRAPRPLTWRGPRYLHLSRADRPHRPFTDSPESSMKTGTAQQAYSASRVGNSKSSSGHV